MKYYRMLLKKPLRDFVRMSSEILVGKENIKYAHHINGSPTVVFENGFCAGMSCMKYWDSTFLALKSTASLFAYDRYDEALKEKEITNISLHLEHKAMLLKQLLDAKNLKPPYLLVGHSLGGLYVQYFAHRYSDEVAGLVLVDAVYPSKIEPKNLLDKNIEKIAEHIIDLPKPTRKSIILLSATQDGKANDKCMHAEMIASSIQGQKAYAIHYMNAIQMWVESGHMIQYEKPETIVNVVREIINSPLKH
jgi:predicted alpha/beta hydrolase family esterase